MGKPYCQDLRSLSTVMQAALDADVTGFSQFLKSAGDLTLQCIASGGSLAAAELCSMLHEICSRRMAKHTTPYEAALSAPLPGCAHLLISGGGNNPDIQLTAQRLIQQAKDKRIQIPTGQAPPAGSLTPWKRTLDFPPISSHTIFPQAGTDFSPQARCCLP